MIPVSPFYKGIIKKYMSSCVQGFGQLGLKGRRMLIGTIYGHYMG